MTTDDIIKTVSKNLPLTKELHEQWVWVITKALNILCENDETVENPEASKYHNKAYSDIYLPKGCAKMGFVEGTIIDFKMKLTPNIYSIATKMIDDMKSNVSVNCCVIISYSRISPFSQNILLNAKLANKDVNIVSLPELLDNYDKFRQSVQEVIGQKNSKYDWEKERDKRIEQARWSFKMMDYYFVLSARMYEGLEMRDEGIVRTIESLGLKRFAQGVMYIMQTVFGMKEDELICEADPEMGERLLSEIMTGGNFGRHGNEAVSKSHGNALAFFWARMRHNLRFVLDYPSEVLWSPWSMVKHHVWKKNMNKKYAI